MMPGRITHSANRLRLPLIKQTQNLQQCVDSRNGIVSAGEPLTEVSASHPLRDVDDLAIDLELKASQQRILYPPHHSSFAPKKGV